MTAATPSAPTVLSRSAYAVREGRAIADRRVRIVHIGLGAFHRSHQAWYTSRSHDTEPWGIAAFTGRSPLMAEVLSAQDGLYTLVERSDAGDAVEVVDSIVEAHDGARLSRFVELIAAPATAVVTLTVTEPGYRLIADGSVDLGDPEVAHDLVELVDLFAHEPLVPSDQSGPRTALGRLLLGLEARRRADAGPIAVVPCDNVPSNGDFVRHGLLDLAGRVESAIHDWIARNVSFVSTSVDRITPQTTDEDLADVERLSGWRDRAPVVTEPFHDWVLCGDFPAGRPSWQDARFVADVEPFERRKLWLLNGAHSLLAYAGTRRGHVSVSEAIADPVCRAWVEEFWDEAARHLPDGLDVREYRVSLLARFANTRIEHRLEQIGGEAVAKLRARIVDVARAELAAGRDAHGCARVVAEWIAVLRGGTVLADVAAASVSRALHDDDDRALIALIDESLARDARFVAAVAAAHQRKGAS